MIMTVYNIDIVVRGECFEIETLYFNEQTKGLKQIERCENNVFVLFERMKNTYLETIKYLKFHTVAKTEEIADIKNAKHRDNRDFTQLISEMEDRVKDFIFYQENLVTNSKDPGFSAFITNEFYRFEQDNHIMLEINSAIFPKEK